jgi:preprotein translocase subunit SecF
MRYYDDVFSRVDLRILILIVPVIGLLLIPAALNIPLGIDFTGGTEVQILTDRTVTSGQLTSALSSCATHVDANVQDLSGKKSIIIRTKEEMTKECIDKSLATLGFTEDELKKILPSIFKPELGKTLLEQGVNVFIIAAILMTIIVFISFRSIVPSLAVIQAALFDIIIALGLLSIMGFELNLPGVAALLMLIGYSVDTDIMLTSRILKQGDKPFAEKAKQAFTTGITITGTTLAAMSAIFAITLFVRMDTVAQIAAVILVGLVVDLATTWLTNLAVLKWYTDKKKITTPRFKFNFFRS